MQVREQDQKTIIDLAGYTSTRATTLFTFKAIAALLPLGFLLAVTWTLLNRGNFIGALFCIGAAAFFAVICWRYLARATNKETLIISNDELTVIRKANGKKVIYKYPVNLTTSISFIGSQQPIDHPLKSPNLDYLGLQTEQQLVNAATAEGNIILEHEGKSVRFGIGIPSWDVVALSNLLQIKTNGLLWIANLPEEIPEEVWNR